MAEEGWNLTWLQDFIGYLESTAFPSLPGNTALTAHAYLPDGTPGPFVDLGSLAWGEQINLYANGLKYTYKVRQVRRVLPENISVLGHEEHDWLTLITCEGFDEQSDGYLRRPAPHLDPVSAQCDYRQSRHESALRAARPGRDQ